MTGDAESTGRIGTRTEGAGSTADLPFPLAGSTLLTGPSNVGKTRLTAAAFEAWVEANGPEGAVVLDFAPEVRRDGRLLGGRLTRFTEIPDGAWYGSIAARAPRAEAGEVEVAGADDRDAAALALARENARRAAALLDDAPALGSTGESPPDGGAGELPPGGSGGATAVFVNDATIPFQADGDPTALEAYCERASVAVCNAFDGDELGTDDPVSTGERAAVDRLAAWADRRIRLADGGDG